MCLRSLQQIHVRERGLKFSAGIPFLESKGYLSSSPVPRESATIKGGLKNISQTGQILAKFLKKLAGDIVGPDALLTFIWNDNGRYT